MRMATTIWLLVAQTTITVRGFADETEDVPTVVFLEDNLPSQAADDLFRAIFAQLSGISITLKRARWNRATLSGPAEISQTARRVADEQGAAMTFWVEDGAPCRVLFFIPSAGGGRYLSRTLDIAPSTGPGRNDVIGIATAGTVEGLLTSHRREIAAAQALPRKSDRAAPVPVPTEPPTHSLRNRRFEIGAAYAGLHFAAHTFGHGVGLGAGLLPIDHLVLGVQFRMFLPMSFDDALLRLTVRTRPLSVFIGGRIHVGDVDFRLGAAYTVDLRSFSVDAEDEAVTVTPHGFQGVQGVSPSLSVVWIPKPWLGLFAESGVDIAVNEKDYKISVDDQETAVSSPWTAKAAVRLGMVIRI